MQREAAQKVEMLFTAMEIEDHENFRVVGPELRVYVDSVGEKTIGVRSSLEAHTDQEVLTITGHRRSDLMDDTDQLTAEQTGALPDHDLARACVMAQTAWVPQGQHVSRQTVLTDMLSP